MLPKQDVVGSNPITRSILDIDHAYTSPEDFSENLSKECLLRHKITSTDIPSLIPRYSICAATEGKSSNTIAIVLRSLTYLNDFLNSNGLTTDVTQIGVKEIRAFIFHLQNKSCFSNHPYSKAQQRGLSGHTINTYLRSIRAFWSWLMEEEIIDFNPLSKLRIPKAPRKVIATFSTQQVEALLSAVSRSPNSYRNMAVILTLLDTGLRVNELIALKLKNIWLDDGLVKVMGKGNKERLVPLGREIRKIIWRYVNHHRPESAQPSLDNLFLNRDGKPLTKNSIDSMMSRYGKLAGLTGIRCSPHTLRHTFAINYLRNGGDVFSLQRILGHSSLEMTRRYCELADVDIKKAHRLASPVDNLKTERRLLMRHNTSERDRRAKQPEGSSSSRWWPR